MTQTSVRRFIFALTLTVLAGCGTTPLPEGTPPPIRYTYALSVEVASEDARKEVEARYGGDALIWHPNAGFAVLGVENSLTPPSVGAQNVEARKESNLENATKLGEVTLSDSGWSYRYTPTSAGTLTLEVVASDAAGNVAEASVTVGIAQAQRWPVQFGGAADEKVEAATTDANGNLYLVGYTYSNLAGASSGDADSFIAKYDSNGNRIWLEQFGGATEDQAEGISTDASGSISHG